MTDEELKATMQDIYNRVCKHLVKQGKRAAVHYEEWDEYTCLYRTPDGLMCAAGCLIKDEFYDPSIERRTVTHGTFAYVALVESGIPDNEIVMKFIRSLQICHDEASDDNIKEMYAALSHAGQNNNLAIPQCLTDALK